MSRKNLILEIQELAKSCGFQTQIRTVKNNRMFANAHLLYMLTITGKIYKIPCLVNRKKAFIYDSHKNPLSSGFKIEHIGRGAYYGITLQSYGKDTDNLLLLNDYTIQCNCGSNKILTES